MYNQSNQIQGLWSSQQDQAVDDEVKGQQADRVASAGARTLGPDPGQHADPGVPKRIILKPLKGFFL